MSRLRSLLFLFVTAGLLAGCCEGSTCIKEPPCKPTPCAKPCDPCAK